MIFQSWKDNGIRNNLLSIFVSITIEFEDTQIVLFSTKTNQIEDASYSVIAKTLY